MHQLQTLDNNKSRLVTSPASPSRNSNETLPKPTAEDEEEKELAEIQETNDETPAKCYQCLSKCFFGDFRQQQLLILRA